LEEVIGRLDEFSGEHAIYAEAPKPGARARARRDRRLEAWRPGRSPTLADEVAAVIHDAWLLVE
jgi:hypothetical protein